MRIVRGTVRVDGTPVRGADVLLVDRDGKVHGAAKSDEQGAYRLAPPDGFTGGGVLARVYRPIAGALLVELDGAEDAVRSFDVPSTGTIMLSGEIVYPAGVTADWVEVSVTPRALEAIPPTLTKALIMDGMGPALLGNYRIDRVTGTEFAVRIMPGTWDLVVSRVLEVSPGFPLQTPNLMNARLVMPGGDEPAQFYGAYRLTLAADTHVRVELERFE